MTGWALVLPIKRFGAAKTRLAGADRAAVAEALARDTLAAVCGTDRVRQVLVVTDAPDQLADLVPSVTVLAQRRPGLNAAVEDALAVVQRSWPGLGRAVLLADVPALTPEDLDATLAAAEAVPLGVVPDAAGNGTVLITARAGLPLLPAFGPGSADRHRALGHLPLDATPGLRRDVDTADDLAEAERLGLGAHTAALVDAVGAQGRRELESAP